MKILHTSDWHLGHLLYQQKRDEEQREFLEWLLGLIREEKVDLVLVAGDVFDTGLPSNYALEMYYSFIARCGDSGCRRIVITGGNHDSPSTLQAPRLVLRALNVAVVGSIDPEHPEAGLIDAAAPDGTPEAVICAVPYLRDRDVHFPRPGESDDVLAKGIIGGTAAWYRRMTDLAVIRRRELGRPDLPILATGHLFAQGTLKGDAERELYVGDLGAFPTDGFPEEISYVALGHLHRAQAAGKRGNIRYSGSPLPFSFDEARHPKQVLILDTTAPDLVTPVPVPVFRTLVKITGDLPAIGDGLRRIPAGRNVPWAEVVYDGADLLPDLKERVDDLAQGLPVRVLACRNAGPSRAPETATPIVDIQEITPETVFTHRLAEAGLSDADRPPVEEAFREILFRVRQGEAG